MGHSSIRLKVRRRKVAHLAAYSHQFTVKNTKQGISEIVNHKTYNFTKNAITCPFTGHKFVPTNPHNLYGKYGIVLTGYDWVEPEEMLWKIPKGGFKQSKSLRKKYKKKYYNKRSQTQIRKIIERPSDYNQFDMKKYVLPKMNREHYMEALVNHKTVKWERKNPQPAEMFTEDVNKWKIQRDLAVERIRDFVVSVYDKLQLIGRFKGTADYKEKEVAQIKDVNGEGHRINDLPKTSKLIKKAQKITNATKKKHNNLVATNLKDHKKQKGRIILPQAA